MSDVHFYEWCEVCFYKNTLSRITRDPKNTHHSFWYTWKYTLSHNTWKSFIYTHNSPTPTRQRFLHTRKRALYIRKSTRYTRLEELYLHAQHLYTHAKGPYAHMQKSPYTHAKEPYIYDKKRPIYMHKSPTHKCKSIHTRKRGLCTSFEES